MPCRQCENGKWKWGESGECRYDSREECERANEGNDQGSDQLSGSKKSRKRNLAKLRAELHSGAWAIDCRTLGAITEAIESSDIDSVQAAFSFGREIESTVRIVNGTAIIPVTGVLRDKADIMVRLFGAASYQLIERDFSQAMQNESVKSILFFIDSPGGIAIGVKRLADRIFAARGEKPIRAFVQGMAASAAYYIAAATDGIDATADSLVGSIGTILPHVEGSKMFAEFGVKHTVFTNSGSPKKGHGNIFEPLSDEARATLQAYVDSYGQPFIADVARYRDTNESDVRQNFGQGDALRADTAAAAPLIDKIVSGLDEVLESLSSGQAQADLVDEGDDDDDDMVDRSTKLDLRSNAKMNERIKAQLFALGLIDSLEASDGECKVALRAWFRSSGNDVPESEEKILAALQSGTPASQQSQPVTTRGASEGSPDAGGNASQHDDFWYREGRGWNTGQAAGPGANQQGGGNQDPPPQSPPNLQQAHDNEFSEARLADLKAAADLINQGCGYTAVTSDMVLEALENKLDGRGAMKAWNKKLAEQNQPIPAHRVRVTGEGADQYAEHAIEALAYRAGGSQELSDDASQLANRPLWAIAAECLQMAGQQVDIYGSREAIAEQAMTMGTAPGQRHAFFSEQEGRQYIQANATPFARPGDFPNILSGLANKFLDTIQLDDDYSYPEVSALLPGGLNDFKPAVMINKGIVEELDELTDAETFKDLNLEEEVLSYIFLRRFGNRWGWTPVLIANDDMGAFAEGMLGLAEAWQVTQNRLVVDQFTANADLLDGNPLFADRADTDGAGNDNDRTAGAAPSDAEWEEMSNLYADIGGINTGRRVRGRLNTIFVPTNSVMHDAVRTFAPLNANGVEPKSADSTANVGIFRGQIRIVPESELNANSATEYYGLRNPTSLNTATVVRAYFNGFGQQGRRERWFDPSNKTTYVSLEGRVAVAVKNWRYAIRNAGTGA